MSETKNKIKSAITEATDYGIDITLLQENLKLSYTERLDKLQKLFNFSKELQKAGASLHSVPVVSERISGYNKNPDRSSG